MIRLDATEILGFLDIANLAENTCSGQFVAVLGILTHEIGLPLI